MSMSDELIQQLRNQVAELQAQLDRLEGPEGPELVDTAVSSDGGEKAVSRRHLFSRAGVLAAGVAGVGIGSLANASPALAVNGTMQYGVSQDSGPDATTLKSSSSGATFTGSNSVGPGVWGVNSASAAPGVVGSTSSDGAWPGVQGQAINLHGAGVKGLVFNQNNNSAGVWGETDGVGSAVYAHNTNKASTAAVYGDAIGTTTAVWGRSSGNSAKGVGVHGESESGRGGTFIGLAAAINLQPSPSATHPKKGQAGDFFVDSAHRLWFCKGGTSWSQLA
jgi:hypothetical protein